MTTGDPRALTDQSGVALIAAERQRQIDAEGWTPEHDDEHRAGELADAAACYARPEMAPRYLPFGVVIDLPDGWPWAAEWWRPTGDPVRDLVKAGALIAAEIDRINRLTPNVPPADRDGCVRDDSVRCSSPGYCRENGCQL